MAGSNGVSPAARMERLLEAVILSEFSLIPGGHPQPPIPGQGAQGQGKYNSGFCTGEALIR